jgi:hypothetical protein
MFILQGVDENYYLEALNNLEHVVPLNFQDTTVPLAKEREKKNIQQLIAK